MSFRVSRRGVLKGLATLPGLATVGCAATEEEIEADEGNFTSSELELLSRYKKFVVVVMENRSFDHYFGHLSLPTSEGGKGRKDVNGFKSLADHTNPDLNGNKVKIFQPKTDDGKPDYMIGDIDHEWEACHEQFNSGKNDGFVKAHQEDLALPDDPKTNKPTKLCWGTTTGDEKNTPLCAKPSDPMAFYTDKDTPVYHQLIDEYVLCDNWFASVMGPTWPNRFYCHSGSAAGRKVNKPLSGTFNQAGRSSIFGMVQAQAAKMRKNYPELLESETNRLCTDFFADVPLLPIMFPTAVGLGDGLDFINFLPNFNYAHIYDAPRAAGVEGLTRLLSGKVFGDKVPKGLIDALAKWRRSPTFESLAKQGKLPPISYIEPPYQLAPGDDHPPHNIMMGQAFVASIYKMLRESPDWEHTLMIVTYDEHGSFYDHVAPPVDKNEENPEFQQLGFRVPAMVIGKGVKKGFVDKTRYDHCSLLSTLGHRFSLGFANKRVEKANPVLSALAASGGSRGTLNLDPVRLSEKAVLESAKYADGQQGIVDRAFHGHVPYEAKRVFTDGMFDIFDRMGIAKIGA
jgi:phospholipase C